MPLIEGTNRLVFHADGRTETRPLPVPPPMSPADFRGRSSEYGEYLMLLRGIVIDSGRGDEQRRQAFDRMLAAERGLWINRLGNEDEEKEIGAALDTLREADAFRFF